MRNAEEPRPLRHPNLAKFHLEEIAALHDQLGNEETRAQAADKLRTLVNRIDLVPDGAELVIVLRGNLVAILTFASGERKTECLNERAILEKLLGRARTIEGQKRKKPRDGALVASQGYWLRGPDHTETCILCLERNEPTILAAITAIFPYADHLARARTVKWFRGMPNMCVLYVDLH